ncbi:1-phosphatidylinositol 4,5-bisphosphate phosphodiesterase delta-3-A-like [Hippocampus comes]|uniref:1-phosphatidylinositol 4,5-bisphosphate phosphodiesterase delta-3-A-like n=1 Tax=Hippocampus comes TaxID=109280 RepID=UPI00094F0CDC|nr:PREDICTED: 1-phosphatidylinositol 4,5-bisphosphate phosphodiesterase delta-3-A-like [Hippocampus comes]
MLGNRRKAPPVRKNGNGTSDSKAIHPLRSLGLQDDEDVKWMLKGSNMVKVRSPHWQKRRTLKLLEDGVTVWCQSHKTFSRAKEQQSFSITEVECVCEGCHSETLRQMVGAVPEGRCLTVVFKGPRKNLDLLCQNPEEAFHWTRGIRTLQERIGNMTQKEKLDQYPLMNVEYSLPHHFPFSNIFGRKKKLQGDSTAAINLPNTAQRNHLMTPNGFTMYMLSKENSVFDPEHVRVYQNMKQPLAHYFISSSHNTYLTKDQLTGESGVEPYIRALNHASPYPLILSLENHCSVEQQAVMARHLKSILGDKLLTKPVGGLDPNTLPSPEDLKGKILVKGKKEKPAMREGTSSSSDLSSSDDEVNQAESSTHNRKKDDKPAAPQMSSELSELVVYTRSVHFKSFQHAAKSPPSDMSSFSESEALRHVKDSGMYFVRHNSHHLSRVYPSGQRLQSSNYNPQEMWNGGCQLVALNFQTPGEQMDLNRGKFMQNGQCGYILKPPFMCQPYTTFNPENVGGGPGHAPVLFTVKVISAQQLPKQEKKKPTAIVDPHVWVEIHGVTIDNNKKKTHHIQNNGFNPQWDCTFNFTIHAPGLALVRFLVEDHDYTSSNDFLGQYTLPFTSLRTGYRHVRLLKQDGSSLSPSSLFIHVEIIDCQDSHSKSSKSQG